MDRTAAKMDVLPDVEAVRRESPLPLHSQFRQLILDLMANGSLQPGMLLPPERDLAARYGVSVAPVRQALVDLRKEGLLDRVAGRGTFVVERPMEEGIAGLTSFTESMREKGYSVRTEVSRQQAVPTPQEVVGALRTRESEVLELERVAFVDNEPVALLASYLSLKFFPRLADEALIGGSLYRTLHEKYQVVPARGQGRISVARCDIRQSELLKLSLGWPLLVVSGMNLDQRGRFLESFRVFYRSDRFFLSFVSDQSDNQVIHMSP